MNHCRQNGPFLSQVVFWLCMQIQISVHYFPVYAMSQRTIQLPSYKDIKECQFVVLYYFLVNLILGCKLWEGFFKKMCLLLVVQRTPCRCLLWLGAKGESKVTLSICSWNVPSYTKYVVVRMYWMRSVVSFWKCCDGMWIVFSTGTLVNSEATS